MRTSLILIIATFIAKIFGFLREIILAAVYGTSIISDAYIVALSIITIGVVMITEGLRSSFLPFVIEFHNESPKKANILTSNLLVGTIFVSTILVLFIYLFSDFVIKIFALGFDDSAIMLTKKILNYSLFSIYFTFLVAIFQGYLNGMRVFNIVSLVSLPMNLILILSIYLSKIYGIFLLGLGKVLGSLSQLIFLLPFAIKVGFKFSNNKVFTDEIFKIAKLALPVTLGTSIIHLNTIVDSTIASTIVEGGVATLNYANRLSVFVQSIVIVSLVTILFTELTNAKAKEDTYLFATRIHETLKQMLIFVIPMVIFGVFNAKDIVTILYQRGNFTYDDTMLVSSVLICYLIGIIFFGIREIFSKVFYSYKDTKTPFYNILIGMVFNIVLSLILGKIYGIVGISIATTISLIVISLLMYRSYLKLKLETNFQKEFFLSLKLIVGLTISSFIIQSINIELYNSIFNLLVNFILYTIAFFIVSFLFKIQEIQLIFKRIRSKI